MGASGRASGWYVPGGGGGGTQPAGCVDHGVAGAPAAPGCGAGGGNGEGEGEVMRDILPCPRRCSFRRFSQVKKGTFFYA
ncbi:hypothetical protein Cba03nite_70720 [Catellatospora bangladeshensis]|uniref:Uncharacterized protein n=1 Tax=Catellatospora bangladeshensis TaxID=310355 RepID=A0A8J3NN61_9ACTN|nr:hypothetical protein Cba03nite_70720 [Catellatospora bangladeshensis]